MPDDIVQFNYPAYENCGMVVTVKHEHTCDAKSLQPHLFEAEMFYLMCGYMDVPFNFLGKTWMTIKRAKTKQVETIRKLGRCGWMKKTM